jgi:hypothetical protein
MLEPSLAVDIRLIKDPFELLDWLQGYMIHREPRTTVTEASVLFFQEQIKNAHRYGYVPGWDRATLLTTIAYGYSSPGKVTLCNRGMDHLLCCFFGDLLMEDEPLIELPEFCSYLIEALDLNRVISIKYLKKKTWITSSAELARTDGVAIDVKIADGLRLPIEPEKRRKKAPCKSG